MEPIIQDLFIHDIRREINGVIKVDQEDDHNVFTELDEYVVTRESLKYIDTFFQRYASALTNPTDKIGVWISGDFGSGKSHFLKILSYLLENREVKGKTALSFFEEKISDADIFNAIDTSVRTGTKDVILFNIDSKSGETGERIVDILMRVFNEKRGYFGDVFWIAELEENLEEKDLLQSFKDEIKDIAGEPWEEVRTRYSFEQDDIVEALCRCDFQSREASHRMFESDGQNYILTPEKFAKAVNTYCRKQGRDHQVIFLIDEIGQYIGDNSQLMLNLQTVAENLGSILNGKAWIIVTSQADIETALKAMKGKEVKQDFSKIQARFDTRVSLSSANVDEVIKKRILRKKEEFQEMLSLFYEEKKIILKNLISFSQGGAEMKNYRDDADFVAVYPFVPYQFIILQKVFEKIRTTGFTGKHLAKGERSMLNAYKESAERYGSYELGALIPFYSFYDTIESFLDPIIKKTIIQAGDNEHLEDFDCLLLKTLFMIRHVQELPTTLDNMIVLSLTYVDEDKLKLRDQVIASLNRLEKETLISKSGDTFHFLTNEEQEINREIKQIDIDRHLVVQEIYEQVFSSNTICQKSYGDYKFNKSVDDKISGSSDADLTIRFLSPLSDEFFRGDGQQSLGGENLSSIDSDDTLLFVFPDDLLFTDQIEGYLQIRKFLKQNRSNRDDDLMQSILIGKQREADALLESSVSAINEGVKYARVFIDGVEVPLLSGSPKERVKDGFDRLIKNVYRKSDYVTMDFESESDILGLLKSDDLERWGLGKSDTNHLALGEMRDYFSVKHEKKIPVVMSECISHFSRKPYGWKSLTISGLIATLFKGEDIRLRYQKTFLSRNPEDITKYLTRRENFDKIIIEIRTKINLAILQDVKSILRDIYDKTDLPEKEHELYDLACSVLDEKKQELSDDLVKYSEEPRYPGKKRIEPYQFLLWDILSVTDPTAFLERLSQDKDEIARLAGEADVAVRFFEGSQKEIFKRILDKSEKYQRNEMFLDEDARESFEELMRIIRSDNPYSDIKQLPNLQSSIESSLAESCEKFREELENSAELFREQTDREFRYSNFYRESIAPEVSETFNGYVTKALQSEDCSHLKIQTGYLSKLYETIYHKTEERIKAQETEIDPKPDPGKELYLINSTELFRTNTTIETEEDLDIYLNHIKEKFQELLKTKKIQVA
ncbi:MAG: BREX system P-loop protein BrxC [Methanospirillaceae archaeon]|nr:BREX system P-loop protein BrxC [Methanospirillaceae archaeon]